MEKKLRITGFILCVIIGITIIKLGNNYFLSIFDTGVKLGDNPFLVNSAPIGYGLIALSPLIIKKYTWVAILIGLGTVVYVWAFMPR